VQAIAAIYTDRQWLPGNPQLERLLRRTRRKGHREVERWLRMHFGCE